MVFLASTLLLVHIFGATEKYVSFFRPKMEGTWHWMTG
jgi:hypothetical protein